VHRSGAGRRAAAGRGSRPRATDRLASTPFKSRRLTGDPLEVIKGVMT
jgi:hypothetical protein